MYLSIDKYILKIGSEKRSMGNVILLSLSLWRQKSSNSNSTTGVLFDKTTENSMFYVISIDTKDYLS